MLDPAVKPADVQLKYENNRLMFLPQDSEEWIPVSPASSFPLTDPEHFISLLNHEQKEVAFLESMEGLKPEPLAALKKAMHAQYVTPQISAIHSIVDMAKRERVDITEWHVETDRGPVVFRVRHFNDSVKQPRPGYVTIMDIEGTRYDIRCTKELDELSKRWLLARM